MATRAHTRQGSLKVLYNRKTRASRHQKSVLEKVFLFGGRLIHNHNVVFNFEGGKAEPLAPANFVENGVGFCLGDGSAGLFLGFCFKLFLFLGGLFLCVFSRGGLVGDANFLEFRRDFGHGCVCCGAGSLDGSKLGLEAGAACACNTMMPHSGETRKRGTSAIT